MKIYLPDINKKKGEALEYHLQGKIGDYFDAGANGEGSFTLDVLLSSSGDKIIARGDFQAEIGASCCRCLQPVKQQISSSFDEVFTVTPLLDKKSPPEELALETANELTISGDYLYLTEYIRQLFFLSQVYNPLCKPDCRGLCAGCGADLNSSVCSCEDEAQIDLRLLKLKELHRGDGA